MNDAQRIIDFLSYSEKLKTEYRLANKSDGNRESVAEHSWELAFTVMLVLPKLAIPVDETKILKMAIIHDIVEIEAKDVPMVERVNDPSLQDKIKEKEALAIEHIRTSLGVQIGTEVYALWQEFEAQKTNEAKVLRALDRLTGQLQFLHDDQFEVTPYRKPRIEKIIKVIEELSKIDPFIEELEKVSREARVKRLS